QFVAAVVTPRIHAELTSWDTVGYGIDFTPARTMTLNNIYVRILEPADLLDRGRSATEWDTFDLQASPSSSRKGDVEFRLKGAACIYGFATWWTAELVPGIVLSTAPDAPRTHWEQLYLPLLDPIEAGAGDKVRVSVRSRTSPESGTTLNWSALHLDPSGKQLARQSLDLEKGYLP
ncbi:MAG: ribonucleotide-diphosphate reductase subunit beta, partial [Hyphomicrobiaceae bacterium]